MWQLERQAGAGGMGDVFLALSPSKERVALKILSRSIRGSSPLFEKEVLLLSRLRHPHIVSILGCAPHSADVFGTDRGPCYWMEAIDGSPLLDAARDTNAERVMTWLEQALQALRYLHGEGVLHGDLSPRNLLIDARGNLKIIDFGLASVLGEEKPLEAATIPYMAPEKIGGVHRPASDLFSLGAVFYEAVSGRHPRSGVADIHGIRTAKAVPLAELAARFAALYPAAARLIDALLENEIARRPATADEALEILRGSEAGGDAAAFDYHSLTFWGAGTALQAMKDTIDDLPNRSALLAVHGATGVGKKRFLREIAIHCAVAGIPLSERNDGRFDVPNRNGALVFRRLETLTLSDLSGLLALRRRLPAQGHLIVLEWNEDFLQDDVRAFFEKLKTWPETRDVSLKNLDKKDALALLQGALGGSSLKKKAGELFRKTGGNPLLLLEAASRMRRHEAGHEAEEDEFENLGNWRDLYLHKILALEPAERDLAAAICVGYGPIPMEDLETFAASDQLIKRLNVLRERDIVAFDAGSCGYRPSSPLLLQSFQELLAPADLADLHRRWLNLWKQKGDPHIERLHHALILKEEAEVTALARPVADLLWKAEKKKELLAILDRVLPLVSDRVERARLLKEKMNAESDLGFFESALRTAEAWFALGPDNDDERLKTVKYRFVTGLYLRSMERDDEAKDRLEGCLEASRDDHPDHLPFRTRALTLLGEIAFSCGQREAAEDYWREALERAGDRGRRAAEIRRHLAEAASARGDANEARRWIENARRLYDDDGFTAGVFATHLLEGNLSLAAGRCDDAEKSYEAAEALALSLDNDLLLAQAWNNRAVLRRAQGRSREAVPLLKEARDVFEMLGDMKQLKEAENNLALAQSELPWNQTSEKETPMESPQPAFDWEPAVARLSDLNRELLRESDMDIVLRRLMDSAMEIAKAQRGFLLLKSDTPAPGGPIPGFDVVVARNINRESLKTAQDALSLSVVQRAMEAAAPVATDNALQDPRFRDAKSVHLGQLRSILALPVHGRDGVAGVFYLDHPLKDGLFQDDLLRALKLFAELASLALQKGALIDELKKKNEDLSGRVEEQSVQMERLQKEVLASRLTLKNEYNEIIGRSPRMVQVLSLVDKVTESKVPVWIFGESGTGKEAIARALHFNSSRKNNPFVTENCSALPESLLESELFGHKKGAFTHATSDKKGLLHYADKGTVFLDEIADMSLNLQAKFLRFLQEGEIRPIGSTQVVKVDVRVVSASNKDLKRLVAEGKFREDLFFRLNGITVKLPPLRERLEDLPLLAEHFLKGRAILAPDALKLLMSYSWPGNVRELQQTIDTAALFAETVDGKPLITKTSLEFKDVLFGAAAQDYSPRASQSGENPSKALEPDLERILRTIRDQCYHKGKAAEALGMSRRHLYTKLTQYGVSPKSESLKAFIEKNLER